MNSFERRHEGQSLLVVANLGAEEISEISVEPDAGVDQAAGIFPLKTGSELRRVWSVGPLSGFSLQVYPLSKVGKE